jgi:LPXTG-site transpeptidase (sortase) family protein
MKDLLERLRANETLRKITGGRPDLLIFGIPIAIVVLVIGGAVAGVAVAGGGDGGGDQVVAGTATSDATTTPTAGANTGEKTPIPISPGEVLTAQDLAARGAGEPGRGPFLGERLVIPKIGVDAPFTVKNVGGDGRMPNPNGANDVAWYDFSQWPGMGGVPNAGGNVVVAGHVDYINVGPAVFWSLDQLVPGDRVQIVMEDGTIAEYEIVFNKHIGSDQADWEAIVAGTSPESITLITCSGEFSAGHYNNRQIVWGRRV